MTPSGHAFEIRRIVVALDNSRLAAAALDAAATLAAQLHAELEGIFVEDINLARLAELPVGREIHFMTGRASDFTAASLEAQYREQAYAARRAIAAAAARVRITHKFRVTRGQVEAELIGAAGEADLLILGLGGKSPGGRNRLGKTTRAAAEQAPHSVLISKPGMRSLRAPLVCYDGSASAKNALEAAIRLSSVEETGLTVLIISPDLDYAGALRQEVDERLASLPVRHKFWHLPRLAPEQVCRFASESGADVLVIGAECGGISGAENMKILEQVACPVLLVR